ncbi:MAG: hypothetical protein MI922_03165 [Bacteroidales bacterium]|nr:hypothetical protein [Bacteroidales bacterium]
MRKYYSIVVLAFMLTLFASDLSAQCKGFAKKICKLELIPYIHDGNYHAAVLSEGEEAELYKTFTKGQKYRLAICGSDALPKIEFKIIDAYKNVIFDNTKHNNINVWDFELESSQQLKIAVKVPVANPDAEFPQSGCVSIMFGLKEE